MQTRAEPSIRIKDLLLQTETNFRLEVGEIAVAAGETLALVGPNGSGKTTIIEILMGLRKFQAGQIDVFGRDISLIQRHTALRRRIGCQLQRNTYANQFKVGEVIALHRSLYDACSDKVADGLEVEELVGKKFARMSGGQKQRVDLFVAMAHKPDLLVLDEPTTGLDRRYSDAFFSLMADWQDGAGEVSRTVVIASHKAEEVALADRIVLLQEGSIADILAMPGDLERVVGKRRYMLGFPDEAAAAAAAAEIAGLPQVVTVVRDRTDLKVFAARAFNVELSDRYAPTLVSYAFAESSINDLFAVATQRGSDA